MTGDKLVNGSTGEHIADMTPDDARDKTDRLKTALGVSWELVIQLFLGRAWAALGHQSWDAYCSAEFGALRIRLPREERDEVIESLRDAGLSIRAIAATGVASKNTVGAVIAASGVPNGDTSTTGTDGKTYDAVNRAKAKPKPEPVDPGVCTEGFGCPATPGPDGMCAWHRGRKNANESSGSDGVAPSLPSDPDPSPEQNAPEPRTARNDDAAPAIGGKVGSPPDLPAPELPSDWRKRLADSLHLLGLDPALVAKHATEDDRIELADLAVWIETFHQATEEQA